MIPCVLPPHPTVHSHSFISPGVLSSHQPSHCTKRTSSYRACHPNGHLILPGALHPTGHVIPLGVSSRRAYLILPGVLSTESRLSHRASHPIKRTSSYRACHATEHFTPPGISSHQARHSLGISSHWHVIPLYLIPPSACHFAEIILTSRITHLWISFHYSAFILAPVHLISLLIFV